MPMGVSFFMHDELNQNINNQWVIQGKTLVLANPFPQSKVMEAHSPHVLPTWSQTYHGHFHEVSTIFPPIGPKLSQLSWHWELPSISFRPSKLSKSRPLRSTPRDNGKLPSHPTVKNPAGCRAKKTTAQRRFFTAGGMEDASQPVTFV